MLLHRIRPRPGGDHSLGQKVDMANRASRHGRFLCNCTKRGFDGPRRPMSRGPRSFHGNFPPIPGSCERFEPPAGAVNSHAPNRQACDFAVRMIFRPKLLFLLPSAAIPPMIPAAGLFGILAKTWVLRILRDRTLQCDLGPWSCGFPSAATAGALTFGLCKIPCIGC